jgi:hypothetical protein
VGTDGIEPSASVLSGQRSTIELRARIWREIRTRSSGEISNVSAGASARFPVKAKQLTLTHFTTHPDVTGQAELRAL